MRRLLAADWVRFGHRGDLRFLVLLVPVVLAIMFVADYNSVTTPPQFSGFVVDPPDPVFEAEMRAQMLADWEQQVARSLPAYAFPASLVHVAGNLGPVALLAIYLAIALVAGEFEWATVRTLHLTSSRGRTMGVRVAVTAGLVGLVMAIGLVFAAIIPFLLTFQGRPLQEFAAPVPNLWADMGIRLLIVLPFVAVPALMAILARSIALAFLLTVLVFAADLAITGAPIWPSTPMPWLPALTVSGSISRVLGGPDVPLASVAPIAASVGALVVWSVVPVLLAIARFRRMDLDE